MKFKILNESNLKKASGLVIIVDVLRAFTTICYVFSNKADKAILVKGPEEGLLLKRENPNYVLIGERGGFKLPGYDYGNSPYELKKVNFSGKTIVMTTSQGTAFFYRLSKHSECKELITGSFVNASSIVNYIKQNKYKTITFVCTDNSYQNNEDYMCVKYLISCLKGKPLNFQEIKKDLTKHPVAERFIKKPLTKHAPYDFELSLQLNKFSFIIKANMSTKRIILEQITL
ncbi:MAG: hypothetical protein A3C30_02890 [Candidatus Levybacteria bacterium RIFCSPHIGHO2_02_FULL_40_18]|nr:MAG: hypothetical protein A2869_05090 [Candidatus Levybacteria bacterium RIFCSPHIGHO2_01_FULL_40_58]OGH26921.1 MAG: hypothetical protein A3C30_02890 [Candidatus Levybacteria bacterium RIFCSPHIGHO2_02_FULL_40_18]OGH32043.1 MAG: hypothetical protein A3E43_03870 [Candidatus Levybacteria bacterium RIFCSPHIGHO2_12_FULL_40_31]OGH40835.1 MAG: hypothetical protein A2894_04530 [Candidatus Levybacteria bacterium RIFCSPLOWO2_01_FULL_40_64]OGH48691.1 MAG: hypothetical protein A3I54_03460 [Candidatus Lev